MQKESLRKTPAQPEKRQQKKATNSLGQPAEKIPSADWLPSESADFIVWGQATKRANAEYRAVLQLCQQNRGDNKLRQILNAAHDLFYYTLKKAYPEGFWEGMDALRTGTSDDLEPYLVFLEADPIFHRSGYAKMKALTGLKRIALTSVQKRRLQNVVLHVVDQGYREEFRHYCRLARSIQSAEWLQEVENRLSSSDPNIALRAKWIIEACRRK